jgi:hypothetical protein
MIGGRKNQSQDQPDAKEKSPETAGKEMGTGIKIPGGVLWSHFGRKILEREKNKREMWRKKIENKKSEIFARKEGDEDLLYMV